MWIAAKELVKPIALFGLIFGAAGAADAEVIVHHFTASNEHGESISGWFSYPADAQYTYLYDYTDDVPGMGAAEFATDTSDDYAFMIDYNGNQFRSKIIPYTTYFEYTVQTAGQPEYGGSRFGLFVFSVVNQDESLWGNLRIDLRSDDPTTIDGFRALPRTLDLDRFHVRTISFGVESVQNPKYYGGFGGTFDSITSTVIPEPASLVSCLVGSAMVGGWWLRRRKAA